MLFHDGDFAVRGMWQRLAFGSPAFNLTKLQKVLKISNNLQRIGVEFAFVNYFCYLCIKIMREVAAIVLYVAMVMAMVLTSCNVKRVMTTRAECYRQGDSVTVIETRSVEEYDARSRSTQLNQ